MRTARQLRCAKTCFLGASRFGLINFNLESKIPLLIHSTPNLLDGVRVEQAGYVWPIEKSEPAVFLVENRRASQIFRERARIYWHENTTGNTHRTEYLGITSISRRSIIKSCQPLSNCSGWQLVRYNIITGDCFIFLFLHTRAVWILVIGLCSHLPTAIV